jgi:hypothetical protein
MQLSGTALAWEDVVNSAPELSLDFSIDPLAGPNPTTKTIANPMARTANVILIFSFIRYRLSHTLITYCQTQICFVERGYYKYTLYIFVRIRNVQNPN